MVNKFKNIIVVVLILWSTDYCSSVNSVEYGCFRIFDIYNLPMADGSNGTK